MSPLQERLMIWFFPLLLFLSLVWGLLSSPLASLTITPATATLAVEETLQLKATGQNTRHHDVPDVKVVWTVEGSSASITPQGVVTAVAPGVVKVTATSDKIHKTATITIDSAKVATLTATSEPTSVPAGAQSQLTIEAKTAQGRGVPGAQVQVTATTAGTQVTPSQVVTDAAGKATVTLTTAAMATSNTVEIRLGEQQTTATVKGIAGEPATLYTAIEPREVIAGESAQLRVRVRDQAGNFVSDIPVRFVTENAAITVTPAEAWTDGQGAANTTVQTPPQAGDNIIQVHVGQLAPLEVTLLGTAGAPTQLTLHADTLETIAGADVTLSIQVRDAQENAVADVPVTFTLLGSETTPVLTTAVTDAKGSAWTVLPTAPVAGVIEIQAQAQELTAQLRITTQPAVALAIAPATASIAIQGTQTLRAMATTATGQQAEVTPAWHSQGTAGAVTEQGIFTATALGTATVTATYGTLQATAQITVVPGDITGVQIMPNTVTLPAGTQQRFRGAAINPHGYPLEAPLSWTVTNPTIGSIDAQGVFTAAITGSGEVVASTSDHTAQARVTVTPGTLTGLTVQPKTIQVQAGDEVQLRVSGRDMAGNIVAVEPTWSMSVDLGELSRLGRFRARKAGIGSIRVSAGKGVVADVPVQVIPGALHHLTLQPDTLVLSAGTEHRFTATGYDAFGNELAVTPNWQMQNDLGPIEAQGKFMAQRVGTTRVQATVDTLTAQGTVNVIPGRLAALRVQPSEPITLTAGEKVSLRVSGQDAHGNSVEPTALWSQPVPLGTLEQDGTFRAEKAGKGTLEVHSEGQSASVQVTIAPGELVQLTIVPAQLHLRAGERHVLQAKGLDAFHNEVPVQVSWQVTEGLGTISASGEFTATQARSGQVTATVGGFVANLPVSVQPGPLAHIKVSPEQLKLAAGESAQVAVSGVDTQGNAVPVQAQWQPVVGLGTISKDGVFTAQKAGKGELVVTADGKTATLPVQVERGALATLRVAPTVLRLASGQQHQCTIQGFDRGGNAVAATAKWELQGNIGTLTAEGLFTATLAGQGTIRATVDTFVIPIEVTVEPGAAKSIRIEPATATLKAGDTLSLTSEALDAAGNRVLAPLTWSVTGELGTLTSTGVFTARRAGTGTITATLGSVTQTIAVQIEAGPLAMIALTPPKATIKVANKQTFAATGMDAYGNAVAITPTWSVQGTIGRIDAQGLFEATTAGTGAVVAVVGNIAGLATVTVEPTTALRLPGETLRKTWTTKHAK